MRDKGVTRSLQRTAGGRLRHFVLHNGDGSPLFHISAVWNGQLARLNKTAEDRTGVRAATDVWQGSENPNSSDKSDCRKSGEPSPLLKRNVVEWSLLLRPGCAPSKEQKALLPFFPNRKK